MLLTVSFRLRTLAFIVACLLPAPHVGAQEINTCIDAKGLKSYQNAPCDPRQRTVAVRAYTIRPEDPTLIARTAAIQQEMDRRNHPGGKAAMVRTGQSRRTAGPTPCQAAKTKREATLKRVGLKRDFDLLSQLDSEVWEVCKGF
jgi:Domain of unknown function (DUF4124)